MAVKKAEMGEASSPLLPVLLIKTKLHGHIHILKLCFCGKCPKSGYMFAASFTSRIISGPNAVLDRKAA